MPRIEKIKGGIAPPLRVTRYKSHREISPRVKVRCGCCEEVVDIYHDAELTGYIDLDILEINGVLGTVAQWRKILLPLLGMEIPAEKK